MTIIVGGALLVLLASFILRLSYMIILNLINGRKFHHSLEQEFNKLRLSNMLSALGINKKTYIYQTRVKDIHQQMENCSACANTDECDEKLSAEDVNINSIAFCNNEAELLDIKQQQTKSQAE